jgi:hypothetical protein
VTTELTAQGQLDYLRKATLQWVNAQRRRMGKPLLDQLQSGVPRDPTLDVMGQSLGVGYVTNVWWHSGDDYLGTISLPFLVREFIQNFDRHNYPELELR